MIVEFKHRWGMYRPLDRTEMLGDGVAQALADRGIVVLNPPPKTVKSPLKDGVPKRKVARRKVKRANKSTK